MRVSLFVDPEPTPIDWAATLGADRVELYTEPFARAFERGAHDRRRRTSRYADAARLAHDQGSSVNAGTISIWRTCRSSRRLPHLAEVSIGHALISHALFVGLRQSVRDYLAALAEGEQ